MTDKQPSIVKASAFKSAKIDPRLHQLARVLAAETDDTVQNIVNTALRFYLAARGNPDLLAAHDKSEGDE